MRRFILFTLLEAVVGICLTAILIHYPNLTLSIKTGLLFAVGVPYLWLVKHNKKMT